MALSAETRSKATLIKRVATDKNLLKNSTFFDITSVEPDGPYGIVIRSAHPFGSILGQLDSTACHFEPFAAWPRTEHWIASAGCRLPARRSTKPPIS